MSRIEDCLSGVCVLVSELMRLVFLFACIVFMLISVLLFAKSFQARYTYKAVELSSTDSVFVAILALSIYLTALSVLGVHAALFRQRTSTGWFSLLAGIGVPLGLAVLMYSSSRLSDSSTEVEQRLIDLQPKYDWTVSSDVFVPDNETSEKSEATHRWDIIQWFHQCCGVQSPADWLPFRPRNISTEMPVSCCSSLHQISLNPKLICLRSEAAQVGCVSQITLEKGTVLLLLSLLIFMSLLMSLVANLVPPSQSKQGYLDV